MRASTAAALLLAAATWTAGSADAQAGGVLDLEAWGGASVGSYEPTGAGVEPLPGTAWGVGVGWGPTERLGAHLSWASLPFGCRGGLCRGFDVSFRSRGPGLGVRGHAALPGEPWAQAGLLLHGFRQAWVDRDGDARSETDLAPGVELAAGVALRLGDRVALLPALQAGILRVPAHDGGADNVFVATARVGVRFRR